VRRFQAADSIVEKATAQDAIDRFKANVVSASAISKRTHKLQQIGTAGVKAAMAAKGAANYSTGIAASKDKFQRGITVVLGDLAGLQGTAPKRGLTIDENLARVSHYAKGLQNAARARYGTA